MKTITLDELERGCAAFRTREARDAMYGVACKLVDECWNSPADVADGLGVVLLTWNQAAYRYGSFDFDSLEQFFVRNKSLLKAFRDRQIDTFSLADDADTITALFDEALDALAYTEGKRKTPVGVAKALHILAPSFFPLWDVEIAKGCGCTWYRPERAAAKYLAFMEFAQAAIASLEAQFANGGICSAVSDAPNLASALSACAGRPRTMLKLLDEYLFARHTKGWI
jgi:hypothetical protein